MRIALLADIHGNLIAFEAVLAAIVHEGGAEATRDGYSVTHHRVAFDRQLVIDQLVQIGHPGRAFLIKHLSGSNQ